MERVYLCWRRRRKKRRRTQANGKKAIFLLFVVLFVILSGMMRWLRPRLAEYAVNKIQYDVTSIIEQSVAEVIREEGTDLSSLETDTSGSTAALTTDSAAVERVRAQVVQKTYDAIGSLEQAKMSVPLGTLIDPQYLLGAGPSIPFGVVGLGTASAQVDSTFTDAGINQTKYCLTMRVSVDVQLHALWCSQTVTIVNEYPLTETVIVGEVPLFQAQD